MNSPGSVTSQQQEYGGQLYYTPDDLREAYTGGYADRRTVSQLPAHRIERLKTIVFFKSF